jgi:hypothetical protein
MSIWQLNRIVASRHFTIYSHYIDLSRTEHIKKISDKNIDKMRIRPIREQWRSEAKQLKIYK